MTSEVERETPGHLPRPVRVCAVLAALALIAVITAGTLVNSNGAALSVPDWPLSYGNLLVTAKWVANVRFEQAHRVAVAVGGLALFALLITLRRSLSSGSIRIMLGWATAGYILQVLLGGAIILLLNPPLLSALHLVLAQVIGTTVLYACHILLTEPLSRIDSGIRRAGPSVRWITTLLVLFFIQIVLGALFRHPPNQPVFVAGLIGHLALAVVIIGFTLVIVVKSIRRTRVKRIRRPAWLLLALLVIQVAIAVPLTVVSPEPLGSDGPPRSCFPRFIRPMF